MANTKTRLCCTLTYLNDFCLLLLFQKRCQNTENHFWWCVNKSKTCHFLWSQKSKGGEQLFLLKKKKKNGKGENSIHILPWYIWQRPVQYLIILNTVDFRTGVIDLGTFDSRKNLDRMEYIKNIFLVIIREDYNLKLLTIYFHNIS